jgi:hypothetical protein
MIFSSTDLARMDGLVERQELATSASRFLRLYAVGAWLIVILLGADRKGTRAADLREAMLI